MSAVSAILLMVKRYVLTCMAVIRRALCCRRIVRRNSGSPLLPTTVRPSDMPATTASVHAAGYLHQPQFSQYSQSQLQSFQSWDSPVSVPNAPVSQVAHQVPEKATVDEDDLFRDMRPQLREQKRLLLHDPRLNPDSQQSGQRSNRFSMDVSAVISPSRELGDLEDAMESADAWNDSELDVEQEMRAAREADRRRRQQEHENRTRALRDQQSSRSKVHLTATRLS